MSEVETGTVQDNAQEVTPNSQNETNETPDVNSYIQESKKYRSRAQEAEAKLNELTKNLEKQEEEKLVEQNKWEELATKKQTELDSIKSDYERLKSAENSYKDELLEKFGEEERDLFKDLSVSQLRVLTEKINNNVDIVPTDKTPARTSNTENKNWTEMDAEERRANWGKILQGYIRK